MGVFKKFINFKVKKLQRRFCFKIDSEYDKKEVLSLLESKLRCSGNIISRLKTGEYILLNGKRVTVREILNMGDSLEIIIPDETSENIVPNSEIPFEILYEDEDILVVDKPGNVPTHPSINHYCDTLANGILAYLGDGFTFRAINRLDRETSGVVLIAKNMLSAHLLSEMVKNREFKKTYKAICHGSPPEADGEINLPIAREMESIIKRCVREDGKEAKTLYRVEKTEGEYSLVTVLPVTGRTHQIRVHFSYIGCPLFGDKMYGSRIENERVRLHCESLEFKHPIAQNTIIIHAKLPEDFFVKDL